MIGALMFLNMRGDIVCSRTFREGFSARALAITFRNELISTKLAERSPVNILEHFCFLHLKLQELYLVMVSNANVDCLAALQYGLRLLQAIHARHGRLDEQTLKQNFVSLQFFIDETADFGFPVITDREALGVYATASGMDEGVVKDPEAAEEAAARVVGAVPWRVPGLLYGVNEMFVDVVEDVNLLLSPAGEVLQSDVAGHVEVNNFLSGMPQCELFLNALAYAAAAPDAAGPAPGADADAMSPAAASPARDGELVPLSDVRFHACVRLGPADEPQRIRFVPPDGEFTLLTYRAAVAVEPPMCVVSAAVRELSRTRVQIEYALKSNFAEGQTATNVEVRVPCPENTAAVDVKVQKGRAKYDPVRHAIIWTLARVPAGAEIPVTAEIRQLAPTRDEETVWSRPPINMSFECVAKSLTGLHLRALSVEEPDYMYQANKWIRYTTKAGQYQCRI